MTIFHPRLCGLKQFPIEKGRYIVFLFETEEFEGELKDSEEGKMYWIRREELPHWNLVDDLMELIDVMLDEKKCEFQYIVSGDDWNVVLK